MRIALLLALALSTAAAQSPLVRLRNVSHPMSGNFQIGDRFEILITAAPNQPVSVRTTMNGRTDWGPIIGSTDRTGRWSIGGQFEKSDFGGWSEVWTVGGKLAGPAVQFSVNAPCLPGGHAQAFESGPNSVLTCDTAEGRQTFRTPSDSDSFRTPDGRLVPVRATDQTQEQYYSELLQDLITSGKETGGTRISLQSSHGALGDETADLIGKLIGVNALNESETRNTLAILRGAFEKRETIQPSSKDPYKTLLLLQHLADLAKQDSLKREIAETIAHVQAR